MKAKSLNKPMQAKRKKRVRKYLFPVVIEKDEGGFFAVCPSLQGCYTQGDTLQETLEY
jgi:hypothetical protein